jgi:phosphoribosylformylglycinamidine synthase
VRIATFSPGAPVDGDVVVVPPGLAGAPDAGALEALRAYARAGGKLLGLADGVAWLCAAELLPGQLAPGAASGPVTATHVRVEGRATPFTWAMPAGRIVALQEDASRPRYALGGEAASRLVAAGRVVLRYCDASGGVAGGDDDTSTIAGVCDETGHVFGVLAPATPALDGALGRQLLACLRGRH